MEDPVASALGSVDRLSPIDRSLKSPWPVGEISVEPKTPPLARRGRAIGDNGSTMEDPAASALGSVDRLSPIDRSLKSPWPVGEIAVEPKTPPLARRGRAIGDNGSTMEDPAASALGSVDRLSPIDRSLKSPWPVGEISVEPKTPPLARRGRAIGDNGSTMEDPVASALGSVDRLSPIDRSLKSPWPVGEISVEPKTPPLARRGRAIGDNGSTMEDPAASALGSVDRLSPIDRSLKSPWPVGEISVEPKTPPLARRGRAIGDNGSTMEDPAASALGSVDRLSPIDRSLKSPWPVGEISVEPKTPPLARRGRAIGDNGSTMEDPAASALGSVDRLSPIDRSLKSPWPVGEISVEPKTPPLARRGRAIGDNGSTMEDAAACASCESHWGQWLYQGSPRLGQYDRHLHMNPTHCVPTRID